MTVKELAAILEEEGDETWAFENLVTNKRAQADDLHALLLLNEIVPLKSHEETNRAGEKYTICERAISAASHDQVWLSWKPEAVAANITAGQAIELRRSGVNYDDETESLYMFR